MQKTTLLLQASGVTLSFGEQKILDGVQAEIFAGDRIGLVGANGCGKTTLLRVLAGELTPDAGNVHCRGELCYLRQFGAPEKDASSQEGPGVWRTRNVYSGGEQMRGKLAAALGRRVPLLLLDEPTANLDTDGVRLLLEELEALQSFVLVSHDRAVLDQVCNHIWALREGRLTAYDGNFSDYRRLSEEERRRQQTEYEQYRDEKRRLEGIYQDKKRQAAAVIRPSGKMTPREARLRDFCASHRSTDTTQLGMERAARSVAARIERLEVKEKPRELPQARFDFSLTNPPQGRVALSAQGLRFSYPGAGDVLRGASLELPTGTRTALCGPNGCGKTTLLDLIVSAVGGEMPAGASGRVTAAPKARIGYFRQGLDNLHLERTVLQNVMESSVQSEGAARGILARLLLRGDDFDKPAGVLSGGERIRLEFAKLMASPANVLLLDEPTNFLDLPSIEALQAMLLEYEGTVLFVSHDRAFADAVAQRTLRLTGGMLEAFDGTPTGWEQRRRKPRRAAASAERQVLELRLSQVVGRLSARNVPDREDLERQYDELLASLRRLS